MVLILFAVDPCPECGKKELRARTRRGGLICDNCKKVFPRDYTPPSKEDTKWSKRED
jgi:transcription initiation factor TFIIIB Brf1 subunit/transcription initiation factor TFIIB